MKARRIRVVVHHALAVGTALLLAPCMVYPFLPGRYDVMAPPLSLTAQAAAVVGSAVGAAAVSLIAALALHHRCVLATRNEGDFAAAGVTLVNPWQG